MIATSLTEINTNLDTLIKLQQQEVSQLRSTVTLLREVWSGDELVLVEHLVTMAAKFLESVLVAAIVGAVVGSVCSGIVSNMVAKRTTRITLER